MCIISFSLLYLFQQVHYILNELVMGGMVLETNMSEIIARIEEQNWIEKQEVRKNTSYHCSFTVPCHFISITQTKL